MKTIKSMRLGFILAALMGVLVSGCYMPGLAPTPTTDILLFTQAAQTFVADLTLTAPAVTGTPVPSATQAATGVPATSAPPATDTPQPSATAEPTATTQPTGLPEATATETLNVIFEEDFEDETGWFTADNDDFTFEFDQGGYRVINRVRNGAIWSIREVEESDVRLEVDAVRSGGPEDGLFGLVCRHVDEDNYYALMVSSSGQYAIAKMEDGEMENQAEGTAPAGLIAGGEASVHIRADCVGDTLALYANGQELARVDEDDFGSGAVGLVTKTNPEPGLDVLFDNFRIIRP